MTSESKIIRVVKDYFPHVVLNALAIALPMSLLEEYREVISGLAVLGVEYLILLFTRASVEVHFRHQRGESAESKITLDRMSLGEMALEMILVVNVKVGGLLGYWTLRRLRKPKRQGAYVSLEWMPEDFLQVEPFKTSDTVVRANGFLRQYPFENIHYLERHSDFGIPILFGGGSYSDKKDGEIFV